MPVGIYAGANVSSGNGVTVAFPYNFKILSDAHIEVKVDGVIKLLGSDYTVTGVGLSNGGNVVFTVAPAVDAVVQRARKVPYKRDQDYQYNGDLREEVVDPDLDTIEMQVQQLAADMARSFKAPLSVTADQVFGDDDWAARAGKHVRMKADGTGPEFVSIDDVGGTFLQSGVGAGPRSWTSKVAEIVSVDDFPPVGDDYTTSFVNAITLLTNGGILYVPPGKRKVTDEIALRPGLTIEGAGAADFVFGAPPNFTTVPSFIWQATNNKAIFTGTNGLMNCRIANLALSSALAPTTNGNADVTGKMGIKLQGSYPGHVWTLIFENLTFYKLERGISCVDPNAGTNGAPYNYDWSVAPVSIRDCRFLYTKYAVYIDTNNADDWTFERCQFQVANSGYGVYFRRSGMMHFMRSFFGGETVNNNIGVYALGNGGVTNDGNGLDNIVFDQCQWETLTHAFALEARGANNAIAYPLTIHMRNCVAELTSDIDIRNKCHFISEGCRWSTNLYASQPAAGDIKISSINDYFDATIPARWYILAGDERDYVQTVKLGPFPPSGPPLMANAALIENGHVWKYDGAAPVASKWKLNDRIINNAPAVGTPKAWLCTVAGTPGTWVSEGNL